MSQNIGNGLVIIPSSLDLQAAGFNELKSYAVCSGAGPESPCLLTAVMLLQYGSAEQSRRDCMQIFSTTISWPGKEVKSLDFPLRQHQNVLMPRGFLLSLIELENTARHC